MSQKPLERLNYYNGQRLEASDLKLEQEYHIAVRRWLNKSLYSPGIARGLEVRAEVGVARVMVSPGLALDAEGHEIILWEQQPVDVVGDARHHQGSSSDAEVEGLYLTIRYDERLTADAPGVCAPTGKGHSKNRPASGGPSRVLAQPLFAWRAFLPHDSSGEVVIAQVELNDTCSEVHQINTGVRRYVGAASAAKVRQYALDGEKNIDAANPGRIYFHIRGRQPNSVTLYLRAAEFPTLFYTEMGHHNHPAHINDDVQPSVGPASQVDAHLHVTPDFSTNLAAVEEVGAGGEVGHGHDFIEATVSQFTPVTPANEVGLVLSKNFNVAGAGITFVPGSTDLRQFGFTVKRGAHSHAVFGSVGSVNTWERPEAEPEASRHTHPFPALSARLDDAGVTDPSPPGARQAYSARAGAPLTLVDDLQVLIGPDVNRLINHTPDILRQLQAARPSQETWTKLGDGPTNANHPLIEKGTGAIKLDFLPGAAFTEGEYVIELRVASGGGRILYNLYIE